MPSINKCNECGTIIREELIKCLEKGDQIFCECCGTPVSLQSRNRKKKEKEHSLIIIKKKIEAKKTLIGIILMNLWLVFFFFSYGIRSSIGVIIFIFVLVFGILEIKRGFKLFINKGYQSQPLMIKTIGQTLLRRILYIPPTEKRKITNENKVKALKILVVNMYIYFNFVFFFDSTYTYNWYIGEVLDRYYFIICIIVDFFYLTVGFIILFKVKWMGSKFLKVSMITTLVFYNSIVFFFKPVILQNWNFILIFLLDVCIFYFTIKIIKDKYVLRQYLNSKTKICYNCGSKFSMHGKFCPKCISILFNRETNSDGDMENNDAKLIQSDKRILKSDISIEKISKETEAEGKSFEPELYIRKETSHENNAEELGLEFLEELSFLKEEKDRNLLKKYFSERFILISEETRNIINKINLSRKEKIDLLKHFAFLSIKEQQDLFDLLINLSND